MVGSVYVSSNSWTYHSERYGRSITIHKGYPSDGATFAPDIDSDGWWVHDRICETGAWDAGTKITNWQASMVLYDIMRDEGYVGWFSRVWRTVTFLIGGGAARENGMFKLRG
jgi:hypothetical protein